MITNHRTRRAIDCNRIASLKYREIAPVLRVHGLTQAIIVASTVVSYLDLSLITCKQALTSINENTDENGDPQFDEHEHACRAAAQTMRILARTLRATEHACLGMKKPPTVSELKNLRCRAVSAVHSPVVVKEAVIRDAVLLMKRLEG